MPRIRSLLTYTEIDVALKSHDCQGNKRHRISRGDARLKVREARGWDHYCLTCAKTIVQRDIVCLREVATKLETTGPSQGETASGDTL